MFRRGVLRARSILAGRRAVPIALRELKRSGRPAGPENRHQHDCASEGRRAAETGRRRTSVPAGRPRGYPSVSVLHELTHGRCSSRLIGACRGRWNRRSMLRWRLGARLRHGRGCPGLRGWLPHRWIRRALLPLACRTYESLEQRQQDKQHEQQESFERHRSALASVEPTEAAGSVGPRRRQLTPASTNPPGCSSSGSSP